MKIKTKYFDEVEINEEDIITFQNGLPGFLEEKQFVLMNLEETVFQVLQSVTTKALAFIVVNPFGFKSDYSFELDDQVVEQLKIESSDDVSILSIVTLRDTLAASTANLKAPLVINVKEKEGKQYIIQKTDDSTKEYIFKTVNQKEDK
ncbi:flagellar assembly factor FliW [Halolactibacillus halophilus]|uniref:Flagellar assembly factor FliW n=1 Tax=Halolactibacillus halophilus TaxID=306540 RepID=A0A1I5QAK6_9BACI|nr:flagellar assembly protein FliW [Halolactibacillus halophilus]GEM01717.1 flagellar assembly factor FliW [Halolactibacillus halophilus]SFP43292.1 flagellar assembly factor FliW [Halolactibacillus halophilus]